MLLEEARDDRSFSSRPRRLREGCSATARSGRERQRRPKRIFQDQGDSLRTRRTIISFDLADGLVGFKPLGQTSTQFMMVWQRNRR